jgi:serine/threonine-protein kinase
VSGTDDTVAGSPYTAETAAAVPALIAGRYQIVRWLGGGGMGRVYEVVDTELGENIALKMLHGRLDDEALARFRREVRLTRKIQHTNIARMFDIGETADGDRFLTMELIDGEALTASLTKVLPWPELQQIAVQICAGLEAAHDKGVVHRDLKPDNVMIERATKRAVLTDFGIARSADDTGNVTQTGMIVGTPRYMAPEQLAGREVDARADLFSLGIVMFEALVGRVPFSGPTVSKLLIRIIRDDAPRVRDVNEGVDPNLDLLVSRLLARDPKDRLPSARALTRALAPFLAQRRELERGIAAMLHESATAADSEPTVRRTAPEQQVA